MNFYVLQNEGNFMASREISAFQEGLCTVETFIYLFIRSLSWYFMRTEADLETLARSKRI